MMPQGLIQQTRQPASAGFSLPANPTQPGAEHEQPIPEQPKGAPQAENIVRIQKILLAARKFMYSEKTHPMFMQELEADDDLATAAGHAAAKVILYLFQFSGMRMKKELVIPAGVLILADIIDFMCKSAGIEQDEAMQEEGIRAFQETMEKYKSDPQQPVEPAAEPAQQPMEVAA